MESILLLRICFLTSTLTYTQQEKVVIKTDMIGWKTENNCDWSIKNNQWHSNDCSSNKAKHCLLSTKDIPVYDINEVTLEIILKTKKYAENYLYIHYTRQVNAKDEYREILDRVQYYPNKQYYRSIARIKTEKYESIRFSFQHWRGYCGSIISFSLYYFRCAESLSQFQTYPIQNAPVENSVLQINGTCSNNAISDSDGIYEKCFSNGDIVEYGKCVCKSGYTQKNQRCVLCRKHYFKSQKGNHKCEKCGMNSYSIPNRKYCLCKKGLFRSFQERYKSNGTCYNTLPTNLKFSKISMDRVHISWDVLNITLSIGNITYIVDCYNCRRDEVDFPIITMKNNIDVANLSPNQVYLIHVAATYKKLTQTIIGTIQGRFKTSFYYKEYKKQNKSSNHTVIAVVSTTVPLVLIAAIIIIILYIEQRKKTTTFLERINSLKKSRRPPPPPLKSNDSTKSDINPYAVFQRLKIPVLLSEDEDEGREEETTDMAGYVSMLANTKTNKNQRVANDYSSPVELVKNIKNNNHQYQYYNHGYEKSHGTPMVRRADEHVNIKPYGTPIVRQVDERDHTKRMRIRTRSCNFSYVDDEWHFGTPVLQRPCKTSPIEQRSRARSCLVSNNNAEEEFTFGIPIPSQIKQKKLDRQIQTRSCYIDTSPKYENSFGAPRALKSNRENQFEPRARAQTFRDSCGYELSVAQLEEAKLKNKYKRTESKNIDGVKYNIPRRYNSADDINKLHDIIA